MLDYEQMHEVAAFGGFPVRYPHWRFGMDFEQLSKSHDLRPLEHLRDGDQQRPAYAYLLEGNSWSTRRWSSRTSRPRRLLQEQLLLLQDQPQDDRHHGEPRHPRAPPRRAPGDEKVESFIDPCLCLENLIDPMSPFIVPAPPSGQARPEDAGRRAAEIPRSAPSPTWTSSSTRPTTWTSSGQKMERERRPAQEDPARARARRAAVSSGERAARAWERDILEIVREEAYYFAPQRQTKVMNEGWASYWHSKIMTQNALSVRDHRLRRPPRRACCRPRPAS